MRNRWLWVFNRNLWTDKGVYVVRDLEAKGLSETLSENELEKMPKEGKVRFVPKDSYKLEYNSPEELSKNGFVIASYGKQ